MTCALAACASKGSSDDTKKSASNEKRSASKRSAPKDAGMPEDSDAAADDAATMGSAGMGDKSGPTLSEPPSKYDCTYDAKNGHGYWFCAAKTMRDEGRRLCADLGGDFLIVDDAQENAWITEQVTGDTYIGYSDALKEGTWIWVDGSEATYTNWDEMEPTEADYAFIEKASGRWKSTIATSRAFACEGAKLLKD
jgi:hypothetical protein